jgi:predicted phage-related endonuclease
MNITSRITHDVQQGTGPWLRLREDFDTASEAPAALGVGRYVTRAELLRRKHTGFTPEPDAATLGRYAAGHAAEAAARPLAEAIVGGELFPVTMTAAVDGLPLLASLDGLTLDGDVCWETKLWNEELAEAVRAGQLPEHYTVQMDQELLVSGASRCLFTCTDGTPEHLVWCWYEADPAKFAALVAGWRQFHADLRDYVLPPAIEPAQAEAMESLPAVSVRLDGALSVAGNLPTFATALRAFIERIPKRPETDSEFATCEAACKSLKKAEEALDAAEAGALASITDVEAMRRAVADCRKLARETRLAAEKMVERRKVEIKEAAVMAARRQLDDHIATLNGEIAPFRVQVPPADFAGAIKGLKSLASIQDKLGTTVAAGKIAADAEARVIRANAAAFKAKAEGLEFLFSDLAQLIHKAADDFAAAVDARIAQHRIAEEARESARKKAEAERIAAAEQRAREEAEKAAAQAAAMRPAPAPISQAYAPQQRPMLPVQGPAPVVSAPKADEPATLKLGDICGRLGFTVSAAFLADVLHIKPAKAEGASKLYTERQFGLICRQLQSHVSAMAELYASEATA